MHTLRNAVTLLFAAAIAAPPSRAGTAAEEELRFYAAETPTVVTAAMRVQKIDQVPGSMTVITDKQISALGLGTLNQALGLVPGFTLVQESYSPMNLVVRGYKFGAGHVKVMLDGHPLNNADHKGTEAWQEMPLDDVKQIEVIRGPGSSLYGSDAFMAVVNVITKTDEGGSAGAAAGSFGKASGFAAHRGALPGGGRFRLSFNQTGERGDRYRYEKDWLTGSPVFGPASAAPITKRKRLDRFDVGGTAAWSGFSLTFRHAENRKQWSENFVHITNPADSFVHNSGTFGEAEYRFRLPGDASLSFKGSYDRDLLKYITRLPGGLPSPLNYGPGGGLAESWILADRYNGQTTWEASFGRHKLIAGAEYGYQYFPETRSLRNYSGSLLPLAGGLQLVEGQDPRNWSLAEHTSEAHWAAFGQDIVEASPLTLILGTRYDHYQRAGNAFSPRVALIWDAPSGQIVKASFGQAFYAPYTSQRYTQAFSFKGDPNLQPEVVKTYDVSVQNAFSARAHYAVTAFINDVSNAFRYTASRLPPLSAYFNSGGQRLRGVELEGRYSPSSSLSLWGNFSYAKGRDKITNGNLTYPRKLANAGVTAAPWEPVTASLYGQFTGESFRSRRGQTGHIAGWGTLNACVGYRAGKSMEIQVSGQNLLDQERMSYNDQGFIPASYGSASPLTGGNDFPLAGRQLLVKATYKWN